MSFVRPALNLWLRLTEKPHMARADEAGLRRSFETKARLFFYAPRGTRMGWETLGGIAVRRVAARGAYEGGPVILYLHGGGYAFGSPLTHQAMLGALSVRSDCPAVLPRYRLAPEYPFPAAPEDALAVYEALAAQGHGVILGGDSAGGGLALALLGEILRLGLPVPLGAFAFSPLTDLSYSAPSIRDNAATDVVLPAERCDGRAAKYLAGADPLDPRASPLFADFRGAPPVWLCAGTTEILLDDTRRMANRLRAQGVAVTEVIETDLPHVWPLFHNLLPEARRTLDELAVWIRSLSPPSTGS